MSTNKKRDMYNHRTSQNQMKRKDVSEESVNEVVVSSVEESVLDNEAVEKKEIDEEEVFVDKKDTSSNQLGEDNKLVQETEKEISIIIDKLDSGEVVDVNLPIEEVKKDSNKPHYQIRRNLETNAVEIVSNAKKGVEKMSQTKKDVAQAMLEQINSEIFKFELEVEISKTLLKSEFNRSEVENIGRQIDNNNRILEASIKKQKALTEIISNIE